MSVGAVLRRNVVYPLWVRKIGSARLRYLHELEASQHWSRQRHEDEQLARFRVLFAHAYATCPYYTEKYRRAGITPDDIRSRADIDRVPPITKEEIQENRDALVSSRYRREDLIKDMTGGSTGSPMQFFYTQDRHDRREAATLRHDRWSGWDIGERRAVLWGAPQDTRLTTGWKSRARETLIEARTILDAASIDEAKMAAFHQKLVDYRPVVLQAYANTLGLFARYLEANGGSRIKPQGIITSAELLTEENRRLIEGVFGCPVYNRYGSREVAVIASECERHQGLHVNAENLLVEVLADGHSALDADGEIAITDLMNDAMPMIRYRIRDVGRLRSAPCTCSRGLPLLDLSGGRVTDFLTATGGSKVSGIVLATYVITNLPGLRQVQFVQSERGSVAVNVVKGPAWSEQTLVELTKRIHHFLGADMRLDLRFLDAIAPAPSGKFRFSISSL